MPRVQFTKSLMPRQIRRRLSPASALPAVLPPVDDAARTSPGPLAGHHVLLVVERAAQDADEPTAATIATRLRSGGARVNVLDCYSTIADLVGHRIAGTPDVVIGMLPGRGPALAAIRAAERLDAPLLALVRDDGPASWGEGSTLRRAAAVILTGEDLRERVQRAGAHENRIEVWHWFTASGMATLEHLIQRTITGYQRRSSRTHL